MNRVTVTRSSGRILVRAAAGLTVTVTAVALPREEVDVQIVAPPALGLSIALPAPAVAVVAPKVIAPAAIGVGLTLPSPTVDHGGAVVAPPPLGFAVGLPSPTVSQPVQTVAPAAIPFALALPAPVVSGSGAQIIPGAIGFSVALPPPSVAIVPPVVIAPAALGLDVELPAPVVTQPSQSVAVPVIGLAMDLRPPSVSLLLQTVSPAALGLAIGLPAPVVTTEAVEAYATPILIEGDSNTAWGYAVAGWPKHMLKGVGGRLYLPIGGNFAQAGAGIAEASYGDNSIEHRQDAFVAKAQTMMAAFGRCHVIIQIGTNSGDVQADIPIFGAWIDAVRATGALVFCNTCPTFSGTFANTGYANTLNAWLIDESNADGIIDVNTVAGSEATDSGHTHYNSVGSKAVGDLAASVLLPTLSAGDVYADSTVTVVPMTGTSGSIGEGATGVLPNGWASERGFGGDATVAYSVTGSVIRAEITGGSATSNFLLKRTVAQAVETGDGIEGVARVNLISNTGDSWPLSLNIAGGTFPFGETWPTYPPAQWNGDSVWPVYPVSQPGDASSIDASLLIFVAPGQSMVLELSGVGYAIREASAAILPANTEPPVMEALEVGGSPSCTNGTWTGSPAPTFAQQFYIGQTPVAADYVVTGDDVGEDAKCFVTATNTAGSVSAESNTVTITEATGGGSGATLDPTLTAGGAISYSNGNLTATNNSGDPSYPRTTTSLASGKRYFEVSPFNGGSPAIIPAGQPAQYASAAFYLGNGSYWVAGSADFSAPNFGPSDIVCAAIDLDARKLWFRVNGGSWNGDPAAGTDGIDISVFTGELHAGLYLGAAVGQAGSIRLAAGDWQFAPPSGFGAW